jgi:Zn finger protein HypA/HybF involved in hydrogenase expression
MKQEIKCRSCGKTMYTLALLPDGKHWALDGKQKYIRKQQGEDKLIICPHCNAEHTTTSFVDESGLSQTQIRGLKDS